MFNLILSIIIVFGFDLFRGFEYKERWLIIFVLTIIFQLGKIAQAIINKKVK